MYRSLLPKPLDEQGRSETANGLTAFFTTVAESRPDEWRDNTYSGLCRFERLMSAEGSAVVATLAEMRELASTIRPEMGVVAQALRLSGEHLRQAYADEKANGRCREGQDSRHVLLYMLADLALPAQHRGLAGLPVGRAPLEAAFGWLTRKDGTVPFAPAQQQAALDLSWPSWNRELAAHLPPPAFGEPVGWSPSYDQTLRSATRAVVRLAQP